MWSLLVGLFPLRLLFRDEQMWNAKALSSTQSLECVVRGRLRSPIRALRPSHHVSAVWIETIGVQYMAESDRVPVIVGQVLNSSVISRRSLTRRGTFCEGSFNGRLCRRNANQKKRKLAIKTRNYYIYPPPLPPFPNFQMFVLLRA